MKRSILLWLLVLLMGVPALAQYQMPQRSTAELPERMCGQCTTQIMPWCTPPNINFKFGAGNIGGDSARIIGEYNFNEFSEGWRYEYLDKVIFMTHAGPSEIGRDSQSWVRWRIMASGWFEIEFWVQGITLQTGYENHISGGAFEGRLKGYRNTLGGITIVEHWSSPEGFAISSMGQRINYGSFTGGDSLKCFDLFTIAAKASPHPVTGAEMYNEVIVNALSSGWKSIWWKPFVIQQPNTDLMFSVGEVAVSIPRC